MVTRLGFVAKIEYFSPQNGDEIGFRRQNWAFPASKRRRERVSSSKLGVSCLKTATRIRFVVEIGRFLPQNGDENRPRRQKTAFLSSNWRREYVSSSKLGVFYLKLVTRFGLVVKKQHFSPQIGDENTFRRQNWAFPASKR
jgi:hypothetical protein